MRFCYRGVCYNAAQDPSVQGREVQGKAERSSQTQSVWRDRELRLGVAVFNPAGVRTYRGVRYVPD